MRKMKLISLLLFLMLFSGARSFAQIVSGTILEKDSNEPLIGATVFLKGKSIGSISGLDGGFSFHAPSGRYDLTISYVGYVRKEMFIDVDSTKDLHLGVIAMQPDAIGLEEIKVVASYAKDRETPVSVSTIKTIDIQERLGSKEFPEILNTTPSVYATKTGGGYGDGRVNLRGFDSNNFAVLINGVPVNGMEDGKVYWSNWAGLSDVSRTMQVQRGLGASKLAISSVGGTINILTSSADPMQGGILQLATGNDGYTKRALTVSTGLMENDWAVTLSGALTTGDGYAKALNFEAYTYFVNVFKKINDKHSLSFTAFGAPQWHNQRGSMHLIEEYRNSEDGIRLNTHYGIREGEIYPSGYGYNEYHKPQISLNHYWDINENSSLSTAIYASFSSGGARRVNGENDHWLEFEYPSGEPYEITKLTADGLLDYDAVMAENAASTTGSQAVISFAVNKHNWYGILSSYNTKYKDFNITAGFDGRYYKGFHYIEITDLLGGDYYLDDSNVNRDANTPLKEGDKIDYYNLGEVFWAGLFAQAEYVQKKYTAFLSGSVINQSYRRTDYFNYDDDDPNQVSDWEPFYAYSIKGGANYNLTDLQHVFANTGYFTRAPYFDDIFLNYTNTVNEDAKMQRIFSGELGYGISTPKFNLDVALYHTLWLDKTLTKSIGNDQVANFTGLNARHQGIEFEAQYKPVDNLSISGMLSLGDWKWIDNVNAKIFNEERDSLIAEVNVYAKGLYVGNAAQTTASISVDYQVLNKFKLGVTFYHFDDIYADFDVNNRTSADEEGVDAWKLPDYQLVNLRCSYDFQFGDYLATLTGNVDNLFDTEYISEASDGDDHDAATSPVYYGFGRTWSATLRLKF
ncbi:TonB-dependent receptor plug [Chloroherpeton thalassium ATCC 35110]|uniref:TonB-dependent receptor plug n=1 Tax=Chloroherpeton thalassium (strain ATCC 35110 / GB-78) TaxID=517418 RepID=B3QYQ1_CHLT3|nr:TonB-dependent receptor [Chloroherpeton thalassium]ACF15124.1 TonB-dependent receptor plug [Chloroherpeton thalassium ATCC 35110]